MKASFWTVIIAFALIIYACNTKTQTAQNQQEQLDSLLLAQGVLKVYDPLRSLIGEPDQPYAITLKDIQKYHGKVCPGIATGFHMFKDVIDSLYPQTQTAIRGQVQVTCSKPNDMLDVAGFIFGIRTSFCCGRSELGKGLLKVDSSLATGKPKQFVMIFRRLDNGRAFKVTFNKFNLMDSDQWPFIDSVLHQYEHGHKIPTDQLRKFSQMVHKQVLNVLRNGPRPNTYSIERIN